MNSCVDLMTWKRCWIFSSWKHWNNLSSKWFNIRNCCISGRWKKTKFGKR